MEHEGRARRWWRRAGEAIELVEFVVLLGRFVVLVWRVLTAPFRALGRLLDF